MNAGYYEHRIDVLLRDDRATSARMGRVQIEAVVATGQLCRVVEMPPESLAAYATEQTRHTHRVHFKRNPALKTSNVLRWSPPGGGTLFFEVKATRRPGFHGLPWVVHAERIENGIQ